MKKFLVIAISLALATFSAVDSFAQMSDDEVVAYILQARSLGKSQSDMMSDLMAKGVTLDQANRLKAKYADQISAAGIDADAVMAEGMQYARQENMTTGTATNSTAADNNGASVTAIDRTESDFDIQIEASLDKVYGHDIFSNPSKQISFEPNENIATPENYKLGPGDELIIDIWGYNEATITEIISPEGKIRISQVGLITLGGLTIKEAESKIKNALAAKYSSIGDDTPNSGVSVTLGAIRTIQVNVMGDVFFPGAYRVSSFATVFTALYCAGGATDSGSLRAISVMRGGKKIADVDIYQYLLSGKSDSDIRLQEGDIIIVPPYVNLVSALGGVKRPMKYEMKDGETVADLLKYSGGFTGDAARENVRVSRNTGSERRILTSNEASGYKTELKDGDVVTIDVNVQRFANRLEIKGYVLNPGEYEFGNGISTVKQLVSAAGGLKEDAFLNRAVLHREKDDLTYEMLSIDLGAIIKGTRPDVQLRKGDTLVITGIRDIQDRGTLTINGLVANPGEFDFAENTTVEDLIILAGGLLDGASMAKVEVSRRVVDRNSLKPSDVIGKSFSFAIKDGLMVDGGEKFVLEPYDVVSVRKSPGFREQQFVTIEGEVAFPGQYVLQSQGERLSSLIKRAGGLTSLAYAKGGRLTRTMTDDEVELAITTAMMEQRTNLRRQNRERRMNNQTIEEVSDFFDASSVNIDKTYIVATDFEKALAAPGSSYDVILREGDVLAIPENVGTVKISGEVLFPNTVMYVPGKPVSYYVDMAGGFNTEAQKGKTYVVYMNGTVSKGLGSALEAGCEIVVPQKASRRIMSASEIMSLGTSSASLAAMIVSLVNTLK